ncbi:MAG: ATP-binding cassette domain-containing protein [Candidatus Dadabacteria bacterium]|nr:MAG: ATP-binding cassette domain-containing protein [Candidatus Dadabacteria bacterium]
MEEPVIDIRNLAISFGPLEVHRDITFQIKRAERVTIMGPSGTGKTLILKSIIGLLRPTAGSVTVLNQPISEMKESELLSVRRHIGMLFQGAALFDSLTVFENVAYGLRERNLNEESEIEEIVREKLDLVGLPGIEHKYPSELSGGQKKRVGLARALATSPQVVLFDEPTTGLDPTSIKMIDELINKINEQYGITVISVTHDIESARRISDRWILVHNGIVEADGPAEELVKTSEAVRDFISGNWKEEKQVLP